MTGKAGYSIVIPARLASTRLPDKLLLAESGKPLIVHTLENLAALRDLAGLFVVTDSGEIASAARPYADGVFISRREHKSGSSRIAEFAPELSTEWILNVQGDEPEIEPAHLKRLMKAMFRRPGAEMGTLGAPFRDAETWKNPNAVKVLRSEDGMAMYFSRAPLPFGGDHRCPGVLHHVGVYAYRRELLMRWEALPESHLEKAERLEQLRALDAGVAILVTEIPKAHKGIDTRVDYELFKGRISG